jgi:hypothetical protein
MLAAIHYYKHCDFYEVEECESMTRAKTLLLLAGYLPQETTANVWRKDDESTAIILPIDEY